MEKQSLKEQAYSFIKTKILNCEYLPGAFLNEELLKEEIGSSRTPVRDALGRLEQEGLVTIFPKKGIIVSEFGLNEIHMIYETRMLIEPYAVDRYSGQIDREDLERMYSLFDGAKKGMNCNQIYQLDDEFHHFFVERMKNKYLSQAYEITNYQNYRLRILSGAADYGRLIDSNREHLSIIAALLEQDGERASKEMRKHLLTSKEAAFRVLMKQKSI